MRRVCRVDPPGLDASDVHRYRVGRNRDIHRSGRESDEPAEAEHGRYHVGHIGFYVPPPAAARILSSFHVDQHLRKRRGGFRDREITQHIPGHAEECGTAGDREVHALVVTDRKHPGNLNMGCPLTMLERQTLGTDRAGPTDGPARSGSHAAYGAPRRHTMPSAQAVVKRAGGARRTSVSQSWKVTGHFIRLYLRPRCPGRGHNRRIL